MMVAGERTPGAGGKVAAPRQLVNVLRFANTPVWIERDYRAPRQAGAQEPARTSSSVQVIRRAHHGGGVQAPGLPGDPSIGPEIARRATTRLLGPRTGAETEATPRSRSAIDWAQPRRRTPESMVAVKRAPSRPRCSRSGSSQANRIWAAEPARMVRVAPIGTESRSPTGAPRRPRRCAGRPGGGRAERTPRCGPAGPPALARPRRAGDPRRQRRPVQPRRGPRTKRPCSRADQMRWNSSATARRWAVGRASPVSEPAGRVKRACLEGGENDCGLVETPTPLPLLVLGLYCARLIGRDASSKSIRVVRTHSLRPPCALPSHHVECHRRREPRTSQRKHVQAIPVLAGMPTLAEKVWADHVVSVAAKTVSRTSLHRPPARP